MAATFVSGCKVLATVIQTGSGAYAALRLASKEERSGSETAQLAFHSITAVAGTIFTYCAIDSRLLAAKAAGDATQKWDEARHLTEEAFNKWSVTDEGKRVLSQLSTLHGGPTPYIVPSSMVGTSSAASALTATGSQATEAHRLVISLNVQARDLTRLGVQMQNALTKIDETRKSVPSMAMLYQRFFAVAEELADADEEAAPGEAPALDLNGPRATAEQLPTIGDGIVASRWNRAYRLLPSTYREDGAGAPKLTRENPIFSQVMWLPPGSGRERPVRVPAFFPAEIDGVVALVPMEYSFLVGRLREQQEGPLTPGQLERIRQFVPAAPLQAIEAEIAAHNIPT